MNWKDSIKSLREKKMNLSQEEFAKVIGVSFASVNRYENGHFEPTIKVKRRILELLKEYDVRIDNGKIDISLSKEEVHILKELLNEEILKNKDKSKKVDDQIETSKIEEYLSSLISLQYKISEKFWIHTLSQKCSTIQFVIY